ncbi:hypothetical protein MPH_06881 [Macrophomina phaseolina MS6]|uniref:Uncharacterized protein n=1 Tax=Macrophomina phaseolina (strain MS6) TaxID=1126212 RepID=K2SGE9_MACPH|nr:hypothetical protein MPH_06881 [Macrophomina phaseolina MS6]
MRMPLDINYDLRGDPTIGAHSPVPGPDARAKIEWAILQYVQIAADCQHYDFLWATVRNGAHNSPPDEPRRHITVEFKDTTMQQRRTNRTAHIVFETEAKEDFNIDYQASRLFPEGVDKF